MERLVGIIIALLALSIMMLIHELGHFIVGRKLGFKIDELMIFMGPVVWQTERKGIRYTLRLFPIGAAVQFAGEYEQPEDQTSGMTAADGVASAKDPSLFMNRPKRYRAAVLAAGSLANILSGILIFFLLFATTGYTIPVLGTVEANTQAADSGLQAGDEIIRLAGERIYTSADASMALYFSGSDSEGIPITVRRDGQAIEAVLTPVMSTVYQVGISTQTTADGRLEVVGISSWQNGGDPVFEDGDIILKVGDTEVTLDNFATELAPYQGASAPITVFRQGKEQVIYSTSKAVETANSTGLVLTVSHNVLRALPYSFQYGWSTIRGSFQAIGALISGKIAASDALSGPVGIVSMISDVVVESRINWGEKFLELLNMIALISLSLGFTNLLPIPLLDGNHLLLLAVEAVRGKPLSARVRNVISAVGLVIIIFLFAYGLYLDIGRIIQG
ncbi:RIP metalloprotease RseP [Oscillospiraceae bacterium HV4-5-C5C]|nr:RIP metalloprotease RseP [Oscillospiraceae bacterium HV4-5-C5C]